jgi:hypothetical protein
MKREALWRSVVEVKYDMWRGWCSKAINGSLGLRCGKILGEGGGFL